MTKLMVVCLTKIMNKGFGWSAALHGFRGAAAGYAFAFMTILVAC